MSDLSCRLATFDDLAAMRGVMTRAIDELQQGFLDPAQVAASHAIMGLDRQLVEDGTYFLVEIDGCVAGCGGWSRRATLYGNDASAGLREPRLLDPAHEAARVRAMYTHPDFTRRGVGRHILAAAETAAAAAGFRAAELMATMAGEPLYRACGYRPKEAVIDRVGSVDIPLLRMVKPLSPPAP
ncbi:MAG: GNAT family N-acetyltransferase [Sphingopyxis granuli]|uniref:GNAT family N-acetyltransferase n=1 Tax=Sphingopyxis granuli TaxID=267128 RepID=UPI003C7383BE